MSTVTNIAAPLSQRTAPAGNTEVRIWHKIGYGLGDAASSMYWKIFGMYLLFFYTDVFGIPAAAAGTMFLVTRVWDSLFDPVVGVMADRTNSRWGKFRPYLLWGAIPFAMIGVLTFYTPQLTAGWKLFYAYLTYSALMMAYSLINVPYASLLGVMSADGHVRTALSSYRMVFAFAGSMLALYLIEPLVAFFGEGSTPQNGWTWAMVVFGVIGVAFFWGCFALTRERIQPIAQQQASLQQDLRDLWQNKPWWILLAAAVAALIFNSIRDGAAVYYFKYYAADIQPAGLGLPTGMSAVTLYLLLGQGANILGVMAATPISRWIGKKRTFLMAMLVATVLSGLVWTVQPNQLGYILVLQVMISCAAGSIFPLLWSMYADIADYSEYQNGRRATGLIFSSSSMAQKFGWTIGGATTGWLLAFVGFEANAVQGDAALNGIKMMMSWWPAVGALLAAVAILFYPLTEEKLAGLGKALANKRGQSPENP